MQARGPKFHSGFSRCALRGRVRTMRAPCNSGLVWRRIGLFLLLHGFLLWSCRSLRLVVDVSNVRDCLTLVKDYFTRTFPNRVFVDHADKNADNVRGLICPHGAPMKKGLCGQCGLCIYEDMKIIKVYTITVYNIISQRLKFDGHIVHIVHTSPTPENPGACMWTMWTIVFCMVHIVHVCPAMRAPGDARRPCGCMQWPDMCGHVHMVHARPACEVSTHSLTRL
jgi:hypothetical protein